MEKADIILRSNAIFNGIDSVPFSGFIALRDNRILSAGCSEPAGMIGCQTQVFDLGDQLICPGFVDVHCFFTGYLLTVAGKDFNDYQQGSEVLEQMAIYHQTLKTGAVMIGRNVQSGLSGLQIQDLDHHFPDRPVILFTRDGESCYMNNIAISEFDFTPTACWPEKCWRLLKYLLNDRDFSIPQFKLYLAMMNSRGITSIKEMGFDDFYGFTDVLYELEKQKQLTARVDFMSQPVGQAFDLSFGQEMREKFQREFVRFSGYNQMTDGSISQMEGLMKQPYLNSDSCCKKEINWNQLTKDTLAADQQGFRFSLHAQGDGAINKVIDIFNQCEKTSDGLLKNRHAITDLECSDPKDLEQMGQLGIIAEIYPQIMSLSDQNSKTAMINQMIGPDRGKHYWNRRKMADSGVVISCGTDLPLLFDDIPESIYHAVGGLFPEGGEPFNRDNTLTISELLKAWSAGGQYNLGKETELGTLEAGKLADLVVFDRNLFNTPIENIREARVFMTIVNGTIVYQQS